MSKAILMSVLFAMIAIPVRAARKANPGQGLRETLRNSVIMYAIYGFALIFLWGRC